MGKTTDLATPCIDMFCIDMLGNAYSAGSPRALNNVEKNVRENYISLKSVKNDYFSSCTLAMKPKNPPRLIRLNRIDAQDAELFGVLSALRHEYWLKNTTPSSPGEYLFGNIQMSKRIISVEQR